MNNRGRAIVVDDKNFSREIMRRLLTEAGFLVVAVGVNGFEAVELYDRERPDVMTLDLVKPEKDGIQALGEIMQSNPKARVIV